MISGVVVLYNPAEEIIENIYSYIDGLQKLYVVDNSDFLNENLRQKIIEISKKIEYIYLNGNKGIAKALNVGKNKSLENKEFKWFLTMDQDSKFKNGDFLRMIEIVKSQQDEKVGIYAAYPEIFDEEKNNPKIEEMTEISTILTSGNLINLKIAREIGDFEEKFFIDQVDHDYCYRLKLKNYKIMLLNNIFLNHKLGDTKKYFFFQVTNHNSIRRYYITRNRCYMIKKYKIKRYIFSIIFDTIKIILFEKDKIKKLKMTYLGIKDYFKNTTGKINEEYIKNKRGIK